MRKNSKTPDGKGDSGERRLSGIDHTGTVNLLGRVPRNLQEHSKRGINSSLARDEESVKKALIKLILKLRVGALKNRSVSKFVNDQYKQDQCNGIITILNSFKESYNQEESSRRIDVNDPLQLIDELTKRIKKEKKIFYFLKEIFYRSKEESITGMLSQLVSDYAASPYHRSLSVSDFALLAATGGNGSSSRTSTTQASEQNERTSHQGSLSRHS